MSAYGHEMDRELSAQSLLTTGASEMGSRYTTEAGIYMSSFAATVLISGLVTLGISVMSLLVALTVMLNSCENRNSGVIEIYRNGERSYDYCRAFAQHAEMNSLGSEIFPSICKDVDTRYIEEGHYMRDLKIAVSIAEDFFSSVRSQMDGRDVVLMDADDLLASETLTKEDIWHNSNKDSNNLRHIFTMKLYLKLQSQRWPLILLSRKPEKLRNATVEELISIGCHGWSSLIMRSDNEKQMYYEDFLSRQRTMMQREGYRIKGVISSQMDALTGPYLGDRVFKLPKPIIRYSVEGLDEKSNTDDKLLQQEV